jgi:hypothetical protein
VEEPVLEEEVLPLPPPPQAVLANVQAKSTTISIAIRLDLRVGTAITKNPANTVPAASPNQVHPLRELAADFPGTTFADVVVIVKVEVELLAEALRVTDAGLSEHARVALFTEQVSATVPAKLPASVTVTVEVPVPPAELTAAAVLERE